MTGILVPQMGHGWRANDMNRIKVHATPTTTTLAGCRQRERNAMTEYTNGDFYTDLAGWLDEHSRYAARATMTMWYII